ncbi:kinesin-like protein KIN-14C isoform X1 [Zingiber officinale]|uniref:kinesin-like protein KIN-14C isoform X1 n=1 Tax=Zingiber officinale TaxID=94328 RepID=UPI001C4DCABC|nr:kinesin-like protein KIN-14C isoform X1 [Zingiber officinale]
MVRSSKRGVVPGLPQGHATMSVPSSPDLLPSPSKAASFQTLPVGSFRPLVRSPARPMKLGVSPELSHSDRTPASRGCADPRMDNLNIDEELAKRRAEVVEWIDGLFPDLVVDIDASEQGLRARLLDGAVLFRILNRFRLFGSEVIGNGNRVSTEKRFDCIISFISAVEQMGLPGFKFSDLEQGPMTAVIYCLWCLKNHLSCNFGEENAKSPLNHVVEARRRSKTMEIKRVKSLKFFREKSNYSAEKSADSAEDQQNSLVDLRLKHLLRASPVFSEPSTPHSDRNGHKFHEVFQLKQGRYSELPAAKISEMLKSNSLDNAPTQSLLSVIHGILEESIERGNGEIPFRVACLLKKVIQEIERRIATQADHIRNQNNLIKAREDKFQSRIRVLETLANASNEEAQMVMNQLDQLKDEKSKTVEKKIHSEDIIRIIKDKDKRDKVVSELKQTLETMKRSYQEQLQQLERNANDSELELKQRLKEAECLLSESRERREQIEAEINSKYQNWSKKVDIFQSFIALLLQSIQGLRESYSSMKHEFVDTEKRWSEEFTNLGEKMKVLTDTADSYHEVLAENRKLYNEVQELKGNIRVYCRIRPFLSEENKRQTSVENIGENGELVLVNTSKQGKDGKRMFNFNKVFGPSATQEEVFLDTRPLIRSVIDGYNVCIFAYGQTGSGKTYTMTGPDGGSEKDWGVNFRALNDLFNISRSKSGTFRHEVSVQMVEIYNEQVRDLLANHGSQQRLGIMATTQPNGLAVPDATIHPVETTSDVLELMKIGHLNRAVCSTALNERSSRSHSILTVHVQGTDLKSETTLRGSLHLVDLAGSERVDRAEVVGDRLKEAQHINKSLSALGDVIFALSQKSSHVPYRNSKLTQVLQSSLGGHAKTLMFVQINPDVGSYSETLSTLKFAERVSGVELGAAKSQKEGKEVRDLIEQVASLKDTIARKEEEVEQLKQEKNLRSQSADAKIERHSKGLLKQNSSPPGGVSNLGATVQLKQKILVRKPVNKSKTAKNHENNSENGYHSESSSQKSAEESKYRRQGFSRPTVHKLVRSSSADVELSDIHDEDAEERSSDISDSVASSMVADTGGSRNSVVEFSLFPEQKKPSETPKEKEIKIPVRIPKPPLKTIGQDTVTQPKINDALKPSNSRKGTNHVRTPSPARATKRWQ